MHRSVSLSLLAIAAAIAAEESPTVIVTAERGESDLARTPASVEVVEAADIRDRGYVLNQSDWLRELPGVGVIGSNGGIDGGTVRVSLRGVDPSFNAVLLDGIPLADASSTDGLLNPSVVNPAGTGRIEVLKGAQSGLYGSGAVGGVINILSARPTADNQVGVRVGGGSFRTGTAEVQASGPIGSRAGFAFGASGLSSRGFSVTTDADADGDPKDYEDDGLQRISAIGRLEFRPTEGLTLYAAGLAMRTAQEYDAFSWSPPYAALSDDAGSHVFTTTSRVSAGGTWKRDGVQAAVDVADTRSERIFRDSMASDDSTYDSAEQWASARVSDRFANGVKIGAGVDWRRDSASQQDGDQPAVWDESVAQRGGYVLLGWSGRNAEVSVTGRIDDHDDFGAHDSGRAAAAVFTEDLAWKLRAAVGNGFVAPTLYQLHGSYPPYSYQGNPDLEAQTALQYEVGADIRPIEDLSCSVTVFKTTYDRRITYATDASWNSTYVNGSSDEQAQGLEAGATLADIADLGLDLAGWYTYIDSDDGSGRQAYYTPSDSGGVRLTARQGGDRVACWQSLGVQAVHGYRSTGATVAGYTLLDAALGIELDRRWEAVLRIENLLDEAYETSPGFTAAPRAAYLSLGARF